MKIKWGKSEDGYVKSKCGRFRIIPEYWQTGAYEYARTNTPPAKRVGRIR